jgi:predicted ATPase
VLTRLYVDNFRCLVNFELRFDAINLFLGANGSGKTSIFDVIRRLQDFVIGDSRVHDAFPPTNLTRWQTSGCQRFELELADGGNTYVYTLLIEHDADRRRMRVQEEKLDFDGKPLFSCIGGTAQLFRDDHTPGPQYPFDWTMSAVGALHERPENRKLAQFKKALSKLIIVRPIPALMARESRGEQERLTPQMENFVSWYRHLAQEYMGAMVTLLAELKPALPGFDSLSLKESGEDSRALKAQFTRPGGGKALTFDFSELSDGQKMLIALYTLTFGIKDEGVSIFIDEPDNFLALREIQPWLSSLSDAVGASLEQVVLISHHPEIVNFFGRAYGKWFDRDAQGPVRLSSAAGLAPEGLTLADTIARDWIKK